jgi:hypothetical protein
MGLLWSDEEALADEYQRIEYIEKQFDVWEGQIRKMEADYLVLAGERRGSL